MTMPTDSDRSVRPPKAPKVTISVENFGPIERGRIDLRPMSIFVGPSNTGKTYFAVLIYAIHRVLHGLPRFPMLRELLDSTDDKVSKISKEEMDRVISKIKDKHSIFFFDLPDIIQETAQWSLECPDYLAENLRLELESCFDIIKIDDLIHAPVKHDTASISLGVRENFDGLWNFSMGISQSGIESEGKIENILLLPEDEFLRRKKYRRRHRYWFLENALSEELTSSERSESIRLFEYLMDRLTDFNMSDLSEIHYLPAARSGIMQSHRVIASSVMARSTRAGLERFSEPLTFSSMVADFIRRLILYDDPRRDWRFSPRRRPTKEMKIIADALEGKTLGGRIRTVKSSPGGYPEFVYRPQQADQDIRLNRASSMVSELAPVILFIRGNVGVGDTLILEEPEAHLHPAAQTEMAVALAKLVRAGVRVVITTHSDWLLQEIGNLMRAGALSEKTGETGASSEGSLRPSDVGVWLFDRKKEAEGSTIREIPFDPTEGVQPGDYEDVAERLYNRSADLQDRLEEAAANGKTRE